MEGVCELTALDSGRAAIEAFSQAWEEANPFNLITLDISMPDLDGTQVLQFIRKFEKEKNIPQDQIAKVLMVTSTSDKNTVIACIKAGCDDYLVKPLNRSTVFDKLNKFGLTLTKKEDEEKTVSKMIETTIQQFKDGRLELPAMPQVVLEIQQIMDDPKAGVPELTRVVEKDAAVSVKLIATANSPIYRGLDKIVNIGMAISRIGLTESRSLISAIANKGLYETKNSQFKKLLERLWLHSLATGHGAKLVSQAIAPQHAEKAFLSGIMHDVGSVLLLKNLGEIISSETKLDEADLINSVYEVHTSFGASLLEKWNFSEDFIKIVKQHEWTKFDPKTAKDILILNFVDNLTHKVGFGFFEKEDVDLTQLDSTQLLEITPVMSDSFGKLIEEIMAKTAGAV